MTACTGGRGNFRPLACFFVLEFLAGSKSFEQVWQHRKEAQRFKTPQRLVFLFFIFLFFYFFIFLLDPAYNQYTNCHLSYCMRSMSGSNPKGSYGKP